ncbi:nicotinate-nucleotide adenylyltransferase [Arcanobacterium phocisimile]|uniref:nicotinate-nucleotide adenylyltransferase n=1 Tax=Arcanobacterium phocisimile TaxID=1302235 RepID=UPI001EF8501A|nr:nicotinate-nucleotide adenylyltransferase [Arcanobacterium phocisimile]
MVNSQHTGHKEAAGTPSHISRRRIGIMGGTFDPIHHGHLVAASEAQHVFGLDEVVFVPAADNPFKQGRHISLGEHRYLMTVIATASNPRFTVSRVDIDRGGKTYTVDTLRDIRKQYPDDELFFITGADVLPQILQWKDSAELWSLAHFVGVSRPGHDLDMTGLPKDGVSLLEIPAMAISSTGIRKRVRDGVPAWYLVPDGVVQYINKYYLYRPEEAQTTALSSIAGGYTGLLEEANTPVKGMDRP